MENWIPELTTPKVREKVESEFIEKPKEKEKVAENGEKLTFSPHRMQRLSRL